MIKLLLLLGAAAEDRVAAPGSGLRSQNLDHPELQLPKMPMPYFCTRAIFALVWKPSGSIPILFLIRLRAKIKRYLHLCL
jgi:hypothetical protein